MDLAAVRWLLLSGVCLVGQAHALYVQVQPMRFAATNTQVYFDDPVAWCQGQVPSGYVYDRTDVQQGFYVACYATRNGASSNVANANGVCPSPPTPSGAYVAALQGGCYVTVSACPTGQTSDTNGVCKATCPGFGTTTGTSSSQLNTTRSDAYVVCVGGCQYLPTVSAKQSDGAWAHWGPFTSMGLWCTGSEAGSGTPAPATCPAAQCPGVVNGTSVCVPCGDVREPPKTTDTTAPPVAAGSAPAGATPGATSTTEQTSCSGGQCTTSRTTTTVGSSGTQTSQTSTTTQPIGTYCDSHPGAAVCAAEKETPSTWGGSCAGFTCGGDAIQCAIAQEQHRRNCALFDTPTALSQKGVDAASGIDPSDHPRLNSQTVDFSLSSMIDSTPLFGTSGSCPSDVSLSVMGRPIVLPFASICPYLTMAGAGFMMLCYLVAALIVFRRD